MDSNYSRYRELLKHHAYGIDGQRTEPQAALRATVEERWDYVHTDATGLEFYLDLHTNLDPFVGTDEQDTIAQGYRYEKRSKLLECCGISKEEFIHEMYRFGVDKRRWSAQTKASFAGAEPWDWRYEQKSKYPIAYEIAKRVFAIPTSSAASERAWSIMGFMHSKKRNKLTVEKVDMLAYIYVNSNALRKNDADAQLPDWARMNSYPESHEPFEHEA